MKITRAAVKRGLIGLGMVVVINLGILGLLLRDGLHDLQTVMSDSMMTRAAGQFKLGPIFVVSIDDKSLAAYGRLENWDRGHYADLSTS